ncbi:MAG: PAC2 family protein, partial [Candidatus Caldarchaeum sp.]
MVLETRIDVVDGLDIDGAVFIEGSPTAGAAGILAVNYLRETFDAVLVAEIVSPHFPQISIIDDDGIASRPKLELYLVNLHGLNLLLLRRVFP